MNFHNPDKSLGSTAEFVGYSPAMVKPQLAVQPAVELSEEQLEIVGQINDLAYENPDLSFHQLMHKVGIKFANEPSFGMFLDACREVFERERQS